MKNKTESYFIKIFDVIYVKLKDIYERMDKMNKEITDLKNPKELKKNTYVLFRYDYDGDELIGTYDSYGKIPATYFIYADEYYVCRCELNTENIEYL